MTLRDTPTMSQHSLKNCQPVHLNSQWNGARSRMFTDLEEATADRKPLDAC
jgi:hypothetical protein